MLVTLIEHGLVWQDWDDVFIVYQPSSAETHFFNETTALILRSLEQRPLSIQAVRERTEIALCVDRGQLDADQFTFAVGRLEELGIIDCQDVSITVQ